MPSPSPFRGRAAVAALAALAATALGSAPASAARRAGSAAVRVEIAGLPKGERPLARIAGPRFRRDVRTQRVTFRGLRPGRYTLTLRTATLRRGKNRGAQAYPAARRASVVVAKRRSARLTAAYGTVVAANTRPLSGRVLSFSGSASGTARIVLPARRGVRYVRGGFLTSGPAKQFPQGLVSRITAVRAGRRSVALELESVPVTTVVPQHSGSLRISVPATGATASAAAARRPRVREYDLSADRNPIATAASDVMGAIPCRIQGALATGSPLVVKPRASGFTLPALEWDRFNNRFHARAEITVGLELQIREGLGVTCGGTIGDFTRTFIAWLGPVPVPFFLGIGFPVSFTLFRSDSDFHTIEDQRHVIDVDSKRSRWITDEVTPQPSQTTGTLSASASGSIGLTAQIGLGLPDVANVRVEFGPKLEAEISSSNWTAPTCETKATLGASAVAEFLLFDKEFEFPSATIFGPYQWTSCGATEPIVGNWRSDRGQGDVRIEAAGAGAFRMVALGDQRLTPTSRCIWLTNGASRPIQGSMGTYTAPYEWMDSDDCTVVDNDPAGRITILPIRRDAIDWCGRTARRSSCVSYTRIR